MRRTGWLVAVLAMVSLVAAACGSDSNTSASKSTATTITVECTHGTASGAGSTFVQNHVTAGSGVIYVSFGGSLNLVDSTVDDNTMVSGALVNYLTAWIGSDESRKRALANILHNEHLARARVLDLIHLKHGGQVGRLGRRLARLDAGERRRGQAELLGYFLELERMSLAQAPELGTESAPTDSGTRGHVKLASS